MADNQAFMVSIDAFVSQAKERQEDVVRVVGIKILARLVQMSPVGNPELWAVNQTAVAYNAAVAEHNLRQVADPANLTKTGRLRKAARVSDSMDIKAPPGYTGGRFRGNWQVSFDARTTDETGRVDKAGHLTMAAGNVTLGLFKVGVRDIYFCNNVPYSYRLEMGHSSQAPGGMVRITAAEFQEYFSQAVSEVKNDTGHHNGA
nr:MAG TPA_asm: tail component [Caudoviricetes sp.]